MRLPLSILCSFLALSASAQETDAPEETPVEIQEAPLDADAPAPSVEMAVKVEMPEIEEDAANYEALLEEVKALRQEFRQLQETLDLLVGQMMADVQEENLQLRHEVQRLAAGRAGGPVIPGNTSELLQQVLDDPLPAMGEGEGETAMTEPAEQPAPAVPSAPFEFSIVQEWGRSPEAVQALDNKVSTLKGIVGVVPRGSARADLEALGRELREKYAEYDNINIEVFDNEEAAKLFADRQVPNPDHRVLSVSRYKDTGRDVILYIANGTPIEVAP